MTDVNVNGPATQIQIEKWIAATSGHKRCGEPFALWLRSGDILCDVMNAMNPGSITEVHRSWYPYHHLQNIASFQRACVTLGMTTAEIFSTEDLYDFGGLPAVLACLTRLSDMVGQSCVDAPKTGHQRRFTVVGVVRSTVHPVHNLSCDIVADRYPGDSGVSTCDSLASTCSVESEDQSELKSDQPTINPTHESPAIAALHFGKTPHESAAPEESNRKVFRDCPKDADLETVVVWWLEETLQELKGDLPLMEWLADGVRLARIALIYQPGFGKVVKPTNHFRRLENISLFLKSARALRVDPALLFSSTDISNDINPTQVCKAILFYALAVRSTCNDNTGPVMPNLTDLGL